MKGDINSLGGGDNGPSREQIKVSPMDEISMIQPIEDANLVHT